MLSLERGAGYPLAMNRPSRGSPVAPDIALLPLKPSGSRTKDTGYGYTKSCTPPTSSHAQKKYTDGCLIGNSVFIVAVAQTIIYTIITIKIIRFQTPSKHRNGPHLGTLLTLRFLKFRFCTDIVFPLQSLVSCSSSRLYISLQCTCHAYGTAW